MRFSRKLAAGALLAACTQASLGAQVTSSSAPPPPSVPQSTVPKSPITLDQLRLLFSEFGSIDATKTLIHANLEKKRKSLPAWFPTDVWTDVERNVEAIDEVEVVLPVYQKYVSQKGGDAMILMLQGPTGKQLADRMLGRAITAVQSGKRGSAADEQAIQASMHSNDIDLWAKRLGELSEEQRQEVQAAVPPLLKIWKAIDDEQDTAYNRKANEVAQATLTTHRAEIAEAQLRATRSASSVHQSH